MENEKIIQSAEGETLHNEEAVDNAATDTQSSPKMNVSSNEEKPKTTRKPRKKPEGSAEEKAEGEEKPKTARKPRKKPEGSAEEKAEGEEKPKTTRKPRKKPEGSAEEKAEGEEKPKTTRKPRKKPEGSAEEKTEGEEKPKTTRKPRKKPEGSAEEKAEGEEKPKTTRKPRKKKTEADEPVPSEDVEFSPPSLELSMIDTLDGNTTESEGQQTEEKPFNPDAILHPDDLFSAPLTQDSGESVKKEEIEEDGTFDEEGQYTISYPELSSIREDEVEEPVIDTEEEELPSYDPEKPRKIDTRFDFVELFVFTLLAVMLITTFFFRHSIVDGDSMENTLYNGEHLIISDFLYTPERGDIIVCEDYSTGLHKPIVKRIIAVGGDSVKITAKGEVYVNGELLTEEYVFIDPGFINVYKPLELVVPEGEIFVMGDHRSNSTDSRNFGTVSVDSVIGRVLLRFYPFDKFGVPK